MATEEIEISQLELAQTVQGDMVMAVDTATDTKSLSLTQVKNWISQPLQTEIDTVDANALHKNQISNCLLEIPQDIKLELSSGVLTLKAGSKLYYPDGLDSNNQPKFITRITTEDYIANGNYGYDATPHILSLDQADYWVTPDVSIVFSGATAPTAGYQFMLWYDTANNVIKWTRDSGSTWSNQYSSLPFGMATYNGGSYENGFKQIDEIFNGFGYIGSTVFALPGVKGLAPYGRNADGTLKSTSFTTSSVKVLTETDTAERKMILGIYGLYSSASRTYDSEKNYVVNTYSGAVDNVCICGNYTTTSGVISNFNLKTAFHAVDYNDFEKAMLKEDWVRVSTAPASPDPDKFYYIPEN